VRRHRLDEAVLCEDLPELRAHARTSAHAYPFSRASPSNARRKRAQASRSRWDAFVPLRGERIGTPALDLVQLVELPRAVKRLGTGTTGRPDTASAITSEPDVWGEVVERRQRQVTVRRHGAA